MTARNEIRRNRSQQDVSAQRAIHEVTTTERKLRIQRNDRVPHPAKREPIRGEICSLVLTSQSKTAETYYDNLENQCKMGPLLAGLPSARLEEITQRKIFRSYKLEHKSVSKRRDTTLPKMSGENSVRE